MDLADFQFLLGSEGQRWLEELTSTPITPDSHLALAMNLREHFSPEQVHALLETVLLRQRATEKFRRAIQMYFTRPALEQASAELVSRYRARRFTGAGLRQLGDLGCSIGGDALALAETASVIGVEQDPVRLAMAVENVAVYGNGSNFQPLQADLNQLEPLPLDGLFFDPGRRDEHGRRLYSVHDYRPPLSLVERWLPLVPHAAVKISPGVDYGELPPAAEVEFISVEGDVREAVLWYGDLHSGVRRRATLLPGEHTLTTGTEPVAPVPITTPRAFLYEPDGAVIRAHLVEPLARLLDATKIDDTIAYLTADTPQATPFARCFLIEETMPFQLKRLRRRLQERNIGRVTVKKRGSPLEPEELQRRLRLSGSETAILFLTHVQGQPYVLIGQSYEPEPPNKKGEPSGSP